MEPSDIEDLDIMEIEPRCQVRSFSISSKYLNDYTYSQLVDYLSPGDNWDLSRYQLDLDEKTVFLTYIMKY